MTTKEKRKEIYDLITKEIGEIPHSVLVILSDKIKEHSKISYQV
jgi:hypothetical protein